METVKADQRGREGNGERTAPCLWAVGVWRNDHMASEVAAAVARKQGAVEDRADLDDADDEAEEDDKEAVESGRRHQAGEDAIFPRKSADRSQAALRKTAQRALPFINARRSPRTGATRHGASRVFC